MTAQIECTCEDAAKIKIREEILIMKDKIKELVKVQKEEKTLLRQNHSKLPGIIFKSKFAKNGIKISGIDLAARLMYTTKDRAWNITSMHIEYNKLRNKPYNMHLYKN